MRTKTKLWPLQQRAFEFIRNKKQAALFMWMGTGKTRVTIEWLVEHNPNKVLIVCPKAVIPVWAYQLGRHTTGADYVLVGGDTKSKKEKLLEKHNIYITNYEFTRSPDLKKLVKSMGFDCVILDESHRIKAAGSKVSRFFSAFPCEYKLLMSGTFTPNKRLDVYGQFRFLEPKVFGTSFNKFANRYATYNPFVKFPLITGYIREDEFFSKLREYAFIATRDQAEGLPPFTVVDYRFDLPASAFKQYKELKKEYISGEIVAANPAVKLLYLQMLTGGFFHGTLIHDARLKLLGEVLGDLPDEPIVIYARFRDEIDAIVGKYSAYELSGRCNEVQEWLDKGGILVVQEQAGSEGIDLSKSRFLIRYSSGFNYGVYEQSNARVIRPNTEHQHVTIIRLIAENTVDEYVYEALDHKRDDLDYVMEKVRNE